MARIPKVFGRNVAKARKAAGLSQRDLAAQMQLAPARIAEIETARRWPNTDRIEDLAAALGVSVAVLFDGV